ncbi:MAG: hypothetical protein ABI867_04150 [Kofleriaceae bacterium]
MTLHLVRPGTTPIATDADWVVQLAPLALEDRGTPPLPPGAITHDQLVQLIASARRVITW